MEQPASPGEVRADLVRALWLVAGAMAIHELEEWNIAEWGARNFSNHTGISDQAIWVGLLFITVVFVGWIFLATRLHNPLAISLVALPPVGLVAIGNSMQHITWTFLFGEYAPGVVSALFLVLPTSILAIWRMLQVHRLLSLPLGFCAGLWVAGVVRTIEAGHEMQAFQVVLHRFCISLAEALGLPGVG